MSDDALSTLMASPGEAWATVSIENGDEPGRLDVIHPATTDTGRGLLTSRTSVSAKQVIGHYVRIAEEMSGPDISCRPDLTVIAGIRDQVHEARSLVTSGCASSIDRYPERASQQDTILTQVDAPRSLTSVRRRITVFQSLNALRGVRRRQRELGNN